MKRLIFVWTAALALLIAGCGARAGSPVGTWQLEVAADGAGQFLEALEDVTCTLAADGGLVLSGDYEAVGTYTSQIVDDKALRLEAATEDGAVWVGTCGVRTYQDGSSTPVLLLSSKDYILSFLPAE